MLRKEQLMPRRKKVTESEINYTENGLELLVPGLKEMYDSERELSMEVQGKDVIFKNHTEFPFYCPGCGEILVSLATQRAYRGRSAPFELWCKKSCGKTWQLGTSELYSLIPSIKEVWLTTTVAAANESTENQESSFHTQADQQTQSDQVDCPTGG
jgi:hypothetical protein